jgi:Family of unknown function (DUF5681)
MGDEKVGYKRPPKHAQFRPGQSGNPKGRPKAAASFKTDLASELRKPVVAEDHKGRTRKISKQRAFIEMLCSQALKNDRNAINALLTCLRHFGSDGGESAAELIDINDLDMLRAYLARAEARLRAQSSPPTPAEKRKS